MHRPAAQVTSRLDAAPILDGFTRRILAHALGLRRTDAAAILAPMRLIGAMLVVGLAVIQPQAPAAPPENDTLSVPMTGGLASLKAAVPTAVAIEPGYDNQPAFALMVRAFCSLATTTASRPTSMCLIAPRSDCRSFTHTPKASTRPRSFPPASVRRVGSA